MNNYSWNQTKESRMTKAKLFTIMACVVSAISFPLISVAEPVVDQFADSSHMVSVDGSALIETEDGTLTVTAVETEPGVWGLHQNQAIFRWNFPGATRTEGFSIKPEDQQFILAIKDMQPFAAPGKSDEANIRVYIYFFVPGQDERLPQSGFLPASNFPQAGSWTIDVREFAIPRFGSEAALPEGLVWRPEFYIATNNQAGVGYTFKSISATDTTQQ